ncbi:PREDICTED: tyrosine kinase receptor Cad96Ca-like isoform X2 [Bactrocera latifrons]|uniref:tyrosine kinase receptor Cad96Ca-like isoform X2 n=1 Tax=Bactrocera latifrons TaxID=174628 RepID=UPI0008DDBE5C|nr:PREDICTED: tyrosine kinase receptor Cad96Ca-like isoform X2 [Bactrocera latifrons]
MTRETASLCSYVKVYIYISFSIWLFNLLYSMDLLIKIFMRRISLWNQGSISVLKAHPIFLLMTALNFKIITLCYVIEPGIEGVTTVAVKTLKENATESEKKDLMTEIEVMKSLEPHINVVRLLACCTDKDPLFVIIEFVNRGKLQTYLRNSRAEMHYGNTHGKSKTLTSGDLTSFMYQVANGMDYLTSRGIIHRDLAARNILITDEHTCKVADFGFARDVMTSKMYERKSEGKLPIRWMAIESLYDNIFSVKSDIWSFGILMWEIVTLGSTPYPGISAADVMRKVRDGYRLGKPEHCRRELIGPNAR